MTPEILQVSQASQAQPMRWRRVEIAAWESEFGYRVIAVRIGEVLCYSAFGPEEPVIDDEGVLSFRGCEYRARYADGHQVPPGYSYRSMTARQPLGCYRSDRYGSAETAASAARAACDEDYEKQFKQGGDDDRVG